MPTRRQVLGYGAAAGLAVSARWPAAAAEPVAARRPNILWLTAEDHYPFVGAYGDPIASTPTLDRLAADGIRYEHSYCAHPVCAPSRFALITGVHPESAGPAHHMRARAELPAFIRGFPEFLRQAGYYCTNNVKTDYNSAIDVRATWDRSSMTAHWRGRPAGAPFFAVFNHTATHESCLHEPNFTDTTKLETDPDSVREPAYLPDNAVIRRDIAHYYDAMATVDGHIAARLAELDDAGLAEDTIVFYYSDNGGVLPRSKRYCYDEGLRTTLIVRVPTRWAHLAPLPPGSVATGAVTSVDYAPTVLALAGLAIPDYVQGRPFLGPSPAPAARYAFGGRGRMDERYDLVRTVRSDRYRYLRNYSPHRPWGQYVEFGWLARGYRSWERAHLDGTLNPVQERFWQPKPAEELYDLHHDRDQVTNLVDDPAHAGVLRRLRVALDQHIVAVNDNGFIPEGSPPEGYAASRESGAYPLREILRLANRAITRDPAHLPGYHANLAHPNEVIRYWAVQGLLLLGAAAGPAAESLTAILRADPSPQVRITAAEVLIGLGHHADEAVSFLVNTVTDSALAKPVRLQAINVLSFIDPDRVRPAAAAIASVITDVQGDDISKVARHLKSVLDSTT